MRLIDADELGIGLCNPDLFPCGSKSYAEGWNQAIKLLQNAPTVDAVEVVRCKDCKYASEFDGCEDYVEQVRCCTLHKDCDMLPKVWPYDFCSYGDREEDDEVD